MSSRSSLAGLDWHDLVTLALALDLQKQDASKRLDMARTLSFPSEAKRDEYVKSWAGSLASARKLLDRVNSAQTRVANAPTYTVFNQNAGEPIQYANTKREAVALARKLAREVSNHAISVHCPKGLRVLFLTDCGAI